MNLRYQVQVKRGGDWVIYFSESSKAYCQGYLMRCREEPMPRSGWRLVDTNTGRVLDEVSERTEVSVGMIAGWPTAKQYEEAAERALESARRVRETEKGRDK